MRLPFRGTDAWGSGSYGALRGNRLHEGIDYAVEPGSYIMSPVVGRVTKLGYPYKWTSDATNYRYVQIEDLNGNRHRIFYIEPLVYRGEAVVAGLTIIGIAQDISTKYQDPRSPMTPHLHYEVLNKRNKSLNPESFHV